MNLRFIKASMSGLTTDLFPCSGLRRNKGLYVDCHHPLLDVKDTACVQVGSLTGWINILAKHILSGVPYSSRSMFDGSVVLSLPKYP